MDGRGRGADESVMTVLEAEPALDTAQWSSALRAEMERLVDREIATVRGRLPQDQLVRQRYLAPAS